MMSSKSSDNDKQITKFHEIVERDDKKVPVASNSDIAIKLLVAVPIWMATILPLTLTYQIGKSIMGLFSFGSSKEEQEKEVSSKIETTATALGGFTVDPTDVIPRPDRKYDLVVLGATGFTGGLAVRHLAKTYGTNSSSGENKGVVKWAIAGRSQSKLDQVKQKLADELNMPELLTEIDTILCDTSDPKTLPSLVKNTRSIATTAGPFSLYGEPVVEYCAKYGTHYSDITGETSFVKLMKSKYQDVAVKSGARILSLCGNDCVPWDLSYNLLADEFAKIDNESMESLEFGNEFSSSASGGTLKTMCMGMSGRLAQVDEEQDGNILRRGFGSTVEHKEPMTNEISYRIQSGVEKPWKMTSKIGRTPSTTTAEDDTLVEAPFVMSGVNYEAVSCSHALRRDPKCSYKEQLLLPDFKTALDGVLGLLLFFTSLMNPITLGLLENYLVTQPGEGPAMNEMENDYFLAVTGTARGNKGSVIQSLLYYNKDPGYLETARMVVECALCLALEEDVVSNNIATATATATVNGKDDDGTDDTTTATTRTSDNTTVGGFFTPGFALRQTLLKRLVDTGCQYELRVIQEASQSSVTVTETS